MDVSIKSGWQKFFNKVRNAWTALQEAYPKAPGAPGFQRTRQLLALAVMALPLGLYGFWIAAGDQPACSVTTMSTRAAGAIKTVTTRNCQLPGIAYYVLVLGLAGMLLWPDVKSFSIGALSLGKADAVAPAKMASDAISGDVLAGSQPAEHVFAEMLGEQG